MFLRLCIRLGLIIVLRAAQCFSTQCKNALQGTTTHANVRRTLQSQAISTLGGLRPVYEGEYPDVEEKERYADSSMAHEDFTLCLHTTPPSSTVMLSPAVEELNLAFLESICTFISGPRQCTETFSHGSCADDHSQVQDDDQIDCASGFAARASAGAPARVLSSTDSNNASHVRYARQRLGEDRNNLILCPA